MGEGQSKQHDTRHQVGSRSSVATGDIKEEDLAELHKRCLPKPFASLQRDALAEVLAPQAAPIMATPVAAAPVAVTSSPQGKAVTNHLGDPPSHAWPGLKPAQLAASLPHLGQELMSPAKFPLLGTGENPPASQVNTQGLQPVQRSKSSVFGVAQTDPSRMPDTLPKAAPLLFNATWPAEQMHPSAVVRQSSQIRGAMPAEQVHTSVVRQSSQIRGGTVEMANPVQVMPLQRSRSQVRCKNQGEMLSLRCPQAPPPPTSHDVLAGSQKRSSSLVPPIILGGAASVPVLQSVPVTHPSTEPSPGRGENHQGAMHQSRSQLGTSWAQDGPASVEGTPVLKRMPSQDFANMVYQPSTVTPHHLSQTMPSTMMPQFPQQAWASSSLKFPMPAPGGLQRTTSIEDEKQKEGKLLPAPFPMLREGPPRGDQQGALPRSSSMYRLLAMPQQPETQCTLSREPVTPQSVSAPLQTHPTPHRVMPDSSQQRTASPMHVQQIPPAPSTVGYSPPVCTTQPLSQWPTSYNDASRPISGARNYARSPPPRKPQQMRARDVYAQLTKK